MRKSTFILVISILITIFVLSIFTVAFAKTAEELLQTPGLTATQRAAIAEAIAKGKSDSIIPTSLKGILEWQEMGDAFATTIERICKTLNVEVNAFLKSDVGMLTAGVIVYKMIGKDLLRIALYIGGWFSITFFIMLSIKFLHMKKAVKQKVKDPEDEKEWIITTTYVERFGWAMDEIKTASLIIHIIAWFAFSCAVIYNVI